MQKKYRIGVIVSRIDYGAAELLEVNLAIQLSKIGCEVFLFPQYSENKFKDIIHQHKFENEKFNVIRLNFDKPANCFLRILEVRKLKLDFILSHNRGGDFLGSFISFFNKTKDIKAFHAYYYKLHINGVLNTLWKKVAQNADYTYHISSFVLEQNRKTFLLNNSKSSLVENSIDFKASPQEFNLSKYNIPNKKKIILSIGRIVDDKGYHNNLDIIIPLLKERNDLIYIFAGHKEDTKLFNELNCRIKEAFIDDKVFYLGQINNVLGLMSKSDIFLHLANREGFGLVLLEALSVCLPIVASNVGGIPEVLKNSNYKSFPISETIIVKEKIVGYLDSGKIEEQEIDKIKNKYSHKNRAENIVRIFDKLSNIE